MHSFLSIFILIPFIFHSCSSPPPKKSPPDEQRIHQYDSQQKQIQHLKQEQETLQHRIQGEKQNSTLLKAFCLTIAITALILGAGIGSRARHYSQKGEIFINETFSNPPTTAKPTTRKSSTRSKKSSPEQQIFDQT